MEQSTGNYVNNVLVRMASNVQIDVLDSTDSFMNLTATGSLADLAPMLAMDNSVSLSQMPQVVWENFTLNGKIYGIPTQIFPLANVYNRTWLDEAGLPPVRQIVAEWTWQKVKEYAQRLSLDINGDGTVDRYGVGFHVILARAQIPVHQAGGSMFDRYLQPTKALFTSEEVYTGLSFFADLVRSGVGTYNSSQQQIYMERKAAILIHGQPSEYDLYVAGNTDEFEVVLQPLGPVRRGANMYFGPLHVVKSERDLEPIWRWVKFICFDPESQVNLMLATGRLPAHLPTLSRIERYVAQYDQKKVNWMVAFREVGIHPDNCPNYFTGANTSITSIFSNEYNKVMRGEESLRTVLERMNQLIQQELDALKLEI
ncbi:MAG TPA: extracellular solute-binding protein [Firmicutes bacterium]|nr:extracellular solute-binding protein [Bacillota bacterium]